MIWKYPPEFDEFIRKTAPGHHDWETAELARAAGFDVTRNQVKCYRANHHIKNGILPSCAKRKYYILFSPEVEQFIRDNVNGRQAKELTRLVNERFGTDYQVSQIQSFKKNRHIRSNVDTKFTADSTNRMAWFKKGNHYSTATEFKKGQIPKNYAEVGTIRVRQDKDGPNQMYIKLTDTHNPAKDWVLYNRYVYEQAHGPIPKGKVVAYLDGDTENCDLDNLICISKSAMTYVNKKGLRCSDPAVMKSIYLMAEVACLANKRNKEVKK